MTQPSAAAMAKADPFVPVCEDCGGAGFLMDSKRGGEPFQIECERCRSRAVEVERLARAMDEFHLEQLKAELAESVAECRR